jgi:hypothetical protein
MRLIERHAMQIDPGLGHQLAAFHFAVGLGVHNRLGCYGLRRPDQRL